MNKFNQTYSSHFREYTNALNESEEDTSEDLHISQETINAVREGMRSVTEGEGGTAHASFKDFEISVGGKTGSAEAGSLGARTVSPVGGKPRQGIVCPGAEGHFPPVLPHGQGSLPGRQLRAGAAHRPKHCGAAPRADLGRKRQWQQYLFRGAAPAERKSKGGNLKKLPVRFKPKANRELCSQQGRG